MRASCAQKILPRVSRNRCIGIGLAPSVPLGSAVGPATWNLAVGVSLGISLIAVVCMVVGNTLTRSRGR